MPLAYDIRPNNLRDFVGQKHLLGPNSWLKKAIETDKLSSMIFFGPPGTGKTTLAEIIANKTKSQFVRIDATSGSAKNLKEYLQQAKKSFFKPIIFIDEIHRFNKTQQDVLLPYIERGDIVLIGATTENPSFTVISPLLSRLKVLVFEKLNREDLAVILRRVLKIVKNIKLTAKAQSLILDESNGDARAMLNMLEDLSRQNARIGEREVRDSRIVKVLKYNKAGEERYNVISALHKSMRDSDPDGALYWMIRMLEAGEDPLYIARRLIRFASEDIGLADPHSLLVATACYDACRFIGMPECDVVLAQAVVHLSLAPKSNACYRAVLLAKDDIRKFGNLDVPHHLRNAVTSLMAEMGYGKGYKYAHKFKGAKVDQQHLPDKLTKRKYYFPTDRVLEGRLKNKFSAS